MAPDHSHFQRRAVRVPLDSQLASSGLRAIALPVQLVEDAAAEIAEASYRLRTGPPMNGQDLVAATALGELAGALAEFVEQLDPTVQPHARTHPKQAEEMHARRAGGVRASAIGAHTAARGLRRAGTAPPARHPRSLR